MRFVARLALVLLVAACGAGPEEGPSLRTPTDSAAAALRLATLASTQRDADPSYAVVGRTAANRAHLFSVDFAAEGLRITSPGGTTTLALLQVGRAETPTALGIAPRVAGNRVDYRRGAVTEWYLNGPLGLEQGFSFAERPDGEGELVVVLALGGDLLAARDGEEIALGEDLRYGELYARDAEGRFLPTAMELGPGTIVLTVDDEGARYPVEIDPLIWMQQTELNAAVLANNMQYGRSVAVDGVSAAVGAPYANGGASSSGAVYIYTRSGTTWTEQARIVPGTPTSNMYFGTSVGLSGDTVAIGAYNDSTYGAVHVFTRSGSTWTLQQRIASETTYGSGQFGISVALSADSLAVGAPNQNNGGGAYVYTRSGTTWTQQVRVSGADQNWGAQFGASVALAGNLLIVGAPEHDHPSLNGDGAAYVFLRSGLSWAQEAELIATDRTNYSYCGSGVGITSDTAVVGCREADVSADNQYGAAYVYTRSGTTWTQQAKLVASDGSSNAEFGQSVAVDGNVAFIGAPNASYFSTTQAGGAYIFTRSGTTWTQHARVNAPGARANDLFGTSVAVDDTTGLVGAPGHDIATTTSSEGAAFAFRYLLDLGDTCSDGTQCHSGYCVDSVCCADTCNGDNPSDCRACSIAAGGTANGTCTYRTSVCRAAAGPCDLAETCTGLDVACPTDAFRPSTTVCRSASGVCDVADNCSGTSADCPDLYALGTVCRVAADTCDVAEACDGTGTGCPTDGFRPVDTPCRAAVGPCDVAEVCNGTSPACPADIVATAAEICRPALGLCDVEELCDGTTAACPADLHVADTTPCDRQNACQAGGTCAGGVCVAGVQEITLTPLALSFADENAVPQTVTVSHTGTGPIITLLGATTSPAEVFPISGGPAWPISLPSGASVTIPVAFTPLSAGSVDGTLNIHANGCADIVVALSGDATAGRPDAGVPDASPAPDAGPELHQPTGCGCRAGASADPGAALLALGLLLLVVRRRR